MFPIVRVFRHYTLSAALLAGLVPTAALPIPVSRDPLDLFAQCAGRFEAASDFARVWEKDRYASLHSRQSDFDDLLEATHTEQNRKHIKRIRRQAKSAHMSLLWRAQYATTETEARIARNAAHRNLTFCQSMLPA